ncbi:protein of unknown function [Lactiplantibacillus plantarum]
MPRRKYPNSDTDAAYHMGMVDMYWATNFQYPSPTFPVIFCTNTV